MKSRLAFALLVTILSTALNSQAAPPLEKWFEVEGATTNTQSSFMLRVDVDRADRIYAVGEPMTVTVTAERDCYLYLLYYGANDQVACLFPNKYHPDNKITGGEVVSVPAPNAEFVIRASQPIGREVLQVIGTLQPTEMFKDLQLANKKVTPLTSGDLKGMEVELKKGKSQDWAEARIDINTVEKRGEQPPAQQQPGKRVAVCVGISKFKSDRIPQLQVSHKDAQRMAAALRDQCKVDDVTLLINEEATRDAIEKAIFHDLVNKTRPGDTVFIFFSCHGGRAAHVGDATSPDEAFDEYLVPYDGELGKIDTMILDKVFARWLRELDGRKIGIILDNCYSGGCTKDVSPRKGAKGLGIAPPNIGKFNFFGKVVKRAKDVGQQGTVLLAACEATQLAWEMPSDEGSVLTSYIVRSLDDRSVDENGDGKISFGEMYRHVKKPVEDYVHSTFNADQNPVLLDYANDAIILKP